MARTNYSFEKRQRELAKKRKKEEKKAAKKAGGGDDGDAMTPNDAALMDLPDAEPSESEGEEDAAGDAGKTGT